MKNKQRCFNCNLVISPTNWRVGSFRCLDCRGVEYEWDENKLVKDIIKLLNYKSSQKEDI